MKAVFFILVFLLFPCLGKADYPDGFYYVGRIINGDTFELTDDTQVRLIGVDAPDTYEYCSEQARQRLASLISGKTVYMKKDVSETDQYKRLLRYVYVGETFVNFAIIDDGYAWATTYPPDVRYSSQLADAEKSARDNNRGCLWSDPIQEDLRGYLQVGCFITMQIRDVAYDNSEPSE